jgi:hypothetical protein
MHKLNALVVLSSNGGPAPLDFPLRYSGKSQGTITENKGLTESQAESPLPARNATNRARNASNRESEREAKGNLLKTKEIAVGNRIAPPSTYDSKMQPPGTGRAEVAPPTPRHPASNTWLPSPHSPHVTVTPMNLKDLGSPFPTRGNPMPPKQAPRLPIYPPGCYGPLYRLGRPLNPHHRPVPALSAA